MAQKISSRENVFNPPSKLLVLLLTVRTIVAAASGNHNAFDGLLTQQAGLAFASVDAVLQLEESLFAVGVDIV
jgi:hypothetical protein